LAVVPAVSSLIAEAVTPAAATVAVTLRLSW